MKRNSLSIMIAGLVVLPLVPAAGQTSFSDGVVQNIFSGSPVSGTLGPGDLTLADGTYFQSWAVSLDGPSLLAVELSSTDFDTYVALALPDNTIVSWNDDCTEGSYDVSCLEVNPTPAGTYYVVVNTYTAGEQGAYTLSVDATPIPVPEPVTGWLVALGAGALLRRRR